jgi:hypothetical protein
MMDDLSRIERCWLALADVDGEPICTGIRLNEPGGPPFDPGFEWVEFVNAATYRGAVKALEAAEDGLMRAANWIVEPDRHQRISAARDAALEALDATESAPPFNPDPELSDCLRGKYQPLRDFRDGQS